MKILTAGIFLLLGTTACRKGNPPMVFEHPQTVCAGRLRLTGPGPNLKVTFSRAELRGVQLAFDPLATGQSLSSAWQVQLKDLNHGSQLTKIVRDDNIRKLALSRTNENGEYNKITDWRLMGDHIFKATTYPEPAYIDAGQRDTADMFGRFRVVADTGSLPGLFCVAGGAIQIPPSIYEQFFASVTIRFSPGQPNQNLDIDSAIVSVTVPDDVTKRHEELIRLAAANGLKTNTLRVGARTVAGLKGHEAVYWQPLDHGEYAFGAEFQFGGIANDAHQPNITITMDNQNFPVAIKPDQLLALWDALLDSMRLDQ